jgi:DNA-directed RNA polymerase subunit RPC12/RpoP
MNEAILIGLSVAYLVLGWSDVSHENVEKKGRAMKEAMSTACRRCGGLMVMEWGVDLLEALMERTPLQRCVHCGHREDEVIRGNRSAPPMPVMPRTRHRTPVAT